jgi:tetratricopeptide (TPR) repeat protein
MAAWFGLLAASPASAADMPWSTAQSVLEATYRDVQAGGLKAVERHVEDLERELAPARERLSATGEDGSVHVLADGSAEALAVVLGAAVDGKKQNIVAEHNPYPLMSLMLGVYYNEIGKLEDALRVLELGLTLSPVSEMNLGQHVLQLMSERAVTLSMLGRRDDALAAYDTALELSAKDNLAAARLQRGRGSVLIDLKRLDDAEAAFRESLKLEPGNALAENELAYIAHIRAGGRASDPTMVLRDSSGQ